MALCVVASAPVANVSLDCGLVKWIHRIPRIRETLPQNFELTHYQRGRPFQELLQYFVMERFLYRLSKSQFRDSFILKGALLLTAWRAPQSRPTMDIDLMGRTDNSREHIRVVVEEICGLAVEQDGVEFREETIEIQRIKEDAEYEGARVRLTATVAKAILRAVNHESPPIGLNQLTD